MSQMIVLIDGGILWPTKLGALKPGQGFVFTSAYMWRKFGRKVCIAGPKTAEKKRRVTTGDGISSFIRVIVNVIPIPADKFCPGSEVPLAYFQKVN